MKTGVYGYSRIGYWACVYDKGDDGTFRIHNVSTGHVSEDSVMEFFRENNIDVLNIKRDDKESTDEETV